MYLMSIVAAQVSAICENLRKAAVGWENSWQPI